MTDKLRIVFVGTVECSRHCLNEVLAKKITPVAILTLPPAKAKTHADYCSLADIATEYDIPLHFVEDINNEYHTTLLQTYEPDLILVWGWSRILHPHILKIPKIGCIGIHPALLPENRGRHPIIWAIALGLTQTGLTFFWMDSGADSGDILAQTHIDITSKDTARTLYDKVKSSASELIPIFLTQIQANHIVRIPQDHSKSNYWRKRNRDDGRIDFRMSAQTIDRLVRALTKPYPGAHVNNKGQEIKVWKCRTEVLNDANTNSEFGKILAVRNNEIYIKTGHGQIVLEEHEFSPLPEPGDYL